MKQTAAQVRMQSEPNQFCGSTYIIQQRVRHAGYWGKGDCCQYSPWRAAQGCSACRGAAAANHHQHTTSRYKWFFSLCTFYLALLCASAARWIAVPAAVAVDPHHVNCMSLFWKCDCFICCLLKCWYTVSACCSGLHSQLPSGALAVCKNTAHRCPIIIGTSCSAACEFCTITCIEHAKHMARH